MAYGRWAISNPDLLQRFKLGTPLTRYDRETFYAIGDKGYTDYPVMQDEAVVAV